MLGSSRIVELVDGAVEPVTLARAKQQLRLSEDFTLDDELIAAYISAARKDCENYLFTALIAQRRKVFFDCLGDSLTLMGPATTVESITYTTTEGSTETLTAYRVMEDVVLKVYPTDGWPSNAVDATVTYTCQPTEISPVVISAMLLKITTLYDVRADPIRIKPTLSNSMLDLERVMIYD